MSIYYISAASGSDVNDGLSESLAWATIDHGMNTVVAGDKVYVRSDGNYNEKATIDTVGSGTLPIIFEGYSGIIGDNIRVIIDAQNTRVNCIDDSLGNVAGFYIFKNFRFTNATNTAFTTSLTLMKYKNCRFDNANSIGLISRQSIFESCEFDLNGDTGLWGSSLNIILGCKFANNVYADVDNGSNNIFYGCTFFSAGEYGINVTNQDFTIVFNSTFDGDGKDTTVAFDCEFGGLQLILVNNIFHDNGTALRNPIGQRAISRNNLFNANTNKYQLGAGTYTDEINGTPNFVNEGTNDYRLNAGSSGIANGFDFSKINSFTPYGMDIGAFQVLGTGITTPFTLFSSSGDLFIHGFTVQTDDLNLFISHSESFNKDIDLFIHGPEQITNNITLSIHGTTSGLTIDVGDDNFGITLDELFKTADFNPQIIGRFTTDPNSVTIEVWNMNNDSLVLTTNVCYQIGDTGRWAWSTKNLPGLKNLINQYVFRMTGDNAETFESQFILKTQIKEDLTRVPRNNNHIRKI